MSLILMLVLSTIITLLLYQANLYWAAAPDSLIEKVNALLPQTQCGQCAFPGCRPYATAIVHGEAAINRCPPGGESTIAALASLLNRECIPLDETHGKHTAPSIVSIREQECIGCTLCIQACPVDAIVGAPKMIHTVLADRCTGCNLCLPPCPVDCIDIKPLLTPGVLKVKPDVA